MSVHFAGGEGSVTIILDDEAAAASSTDATSAHAGPHAGAPHGGGPVRRDASGLLALRPLQPFTHLLASDADGTGALPGCIGSSMNNNSIHRHGSVWSGQGGSAGTWTLHLEYAVVGATAQHAEVEAPEAPVGPVAMNVFSAAVPAGGMGDDGSHAPAPGVSGEMGPVTDSPWGAFVATAVNATSRSPQPPEPATRPPPQQQPSPPPFRLSRWSLRLCGCRVPAYTRLASLLLPRPQLLPQPQLLAPESRQAGLGLLGVSPTTRTSNNTGDSSRSSNGTCWWPEAQTAAFDEAAAAAAEESEGVSSDGGGPHSAAWQSPQQVPVEAVPGPERSRGNAAADTAADLMSTFTAQQANPGAGGDTRRSDRNGASPNSTVSRNGVAPQQQQQQQQEEEAQSSSWESSLSAAAELLMAQRADANGLGNGGGLSESAGRGGAAAAGFGLGTALGKRLGQRAPAAMSRQQRRQQRRQGLVPEPLLQAGWVAQMRQAVRRLLREGRPRSGGAGGRGAGGGRGGGSDLQVDLEARAGLPYVLQVAALCYTDLYLCYNSYFRVEPFSSVVGSSAAAPSAAEAGGGEGEGGGGEYGGYGYGYGYEYGGGGGYEYDELVAGEAGNVGGDTGEGPGEIGSMDMGQSADPAVDPDATAGAGAVAAGTGGAQQQSAARQQLGRGPGGFDQWLAAFEARVQDRYRQHYAPRAAAAFTRAEQQLQAALASWPDAVSRAGTAGAGAGTPAQRQQAQQLRAFLNARLYAAAYRSAQLSYSSAYMDAVIGLALYGKIAELAINPRFITTRLLLIVLDGAVATSLIGLTQATFTVTPNVVGNSTILAAPNSTSTTNGSSSGGVSSSPAGGGPILAAAAAAGNLLTSAAATAAASGLLRNASLDSTDTAAFRDPLRSSTGSTSSIGSGGSSSIRGGGSPLLAALQNTSRAVLARATRAMADASTADVYPSANGGAAIGLGRAGLGRAAGDGAAPWLDAAEQAVAALAGAFGERPASSLSAARARLRHTPMATAAAAGGGGAGSSAVVREPAGGLGGGLRGSSGAGSSGAGMLRQEAVQAFTAALSRLLQQGEQATAVLEAMQQGRTAVLDVRQQALYDTAARMATGGGIVARPGSAAAAAKNGTSSTAADGTAAGVTRSSADATANTGGPLARAAGAGLSARAEAATAAAARVRERWGPLLAAAGSNNSSIHSSVYRSGGGDGGTPTSGGTPSPSGQSPAHHQQQQQPPQDQRDQQGQGQAPLRPSTAEHTSTSESADSAAAGGAAGAAGDDADALVWSGATRKPPPARPAVVAAAVRGTDDGKQALDEPFGEATDGEQRQKPPATRRSGAGVGPSPLPEDTSGAGGVAAGGQWAEDDAAPLTWVPKNSKGTGRTAG
ncbi:hypothetical protein HXX76_011871 [Chlamydomonas incerta]|uniref:Uncharacterized protein n=1 Tax=Chlamydomonas incerta TaxID=51695 RepID=A0A835SM95_CHLIN|nr:hypothetical protein HXX76_011871 [Chlamydomonas incerta]|eukprot:KAG2428191.1 hypothetical protein HXX76_011871 [Chlamydomonas incerta]